jgi:ribosomal protein L21E
VGVIVGARGESVKGFIVLGAREKRVIVAVKNNYERRVLYITGY